MVSLEKLYDCRIHISTCYCDQLSKLESKYSYYIQSLLQQKASIRVGLQHRFEQQLQIIDKKINSITNSSSGTLNYNDTSAHCCNSIKTHKSKTETCYMRDSFTNFIHNE